MAGFYCEIDKDGYCYHVTQDELTLSETILFAEENMFGKTWNGESWVETPKNEEENVPSEENNEYKQYYETVNAAILGGE